MDDFFAAVSTTSETASRVGDSSTTTTTSSHNASFLGFRPRRQRRPEQGQKDASNESPQQQQRRFKATKRVRLWTEIAPWQQQGSELILTGYRDVSGSVVACVHSWTYTHNETVNIYSHLLGLLVFCGFLGTLLAWCWPWQRPDRSVARAASLSDTLAAAAFLLGVAVCFALSTAFHTLMSHSHAVCRIGMALDIAGILVLMWSATVPLIHFGLACAPPPIRWALHATTSTLALLCAVVAAADSAPPFASVLAVFQGPRHGQRRAALFCAFALVSFAVPLLYGSLVLQDPDLSRRAALWPGVAGTLTFDIVAAVAYSLKFPEKWFPRRFDIVGASHQIMHIMVLIAALSYVHAVDSALLFRQGDGAHCRIPFAARTPSITV